MYNLHDRLAMRLASTIVDRMVTDDRISRDAGQILFDTLSDALVALSDDELLSLMEGLLHPADEVDEVVNDY